MTSIRYLQISGLSLCAAGFIAGCSTNRGGADFNPTLESGTPLRTADPEMPLSQRRVDITDSGPGTPRGDKTGADPAETSSQGAGSRNLVGTPGRDKTRIIVEEPGTVSQSPAVVVRTPAQDNAAAAASTPAEITSVNTLADTNQIASITGKPVRLSDVKVQAVVGPRLIVVGQEGHPVYVRLPQPMVNLSEGSTINLEGTVRGTEAVTQAAQELTGEGAHVLTQQPVFVEGRTIQVIGQ